MSATRHRRLLRVWTPLLALIALAAGLRAAHARGQGLWGDELFSLAVATGHSLEGPPETWNPARGDFYHYEIPVTTAGLRQYLEHDKPIASPARVCRAVLLSDTNPPGYYLGLWLWTLVAGTRDASVRLFSVAWAVACVPLLWSVGRMLGGRRVAFAACLLFAVLPLSIDFAIEARMYSMLWFWTVATAWATLSLHSRGGRAHLFALWVLASVGGLLTHYFFVFAWGPMALWLLILPGRLRRWHVLTCGVAVVLLIAPWYVQVPRSLAAWRVTKDWLKDPRMVGQDGYHPLIYFARSATAPFFERRASENPTTGDWVLKGVVAAVGLVLLAWTARRAVTGRRLLAWSWFLGPILGLYVFDFLQDTYTAALPRYAFAAVPAAMLLAGVGLSRLPRPARALLLTVLVLASLPALNRLFRSDARSHWYRPVARLLNHRGGTDELILVHGIPSGALGVARYMHSTTPIALWTQQLRRYEGRTGAEAVASDVAELTTGRRKVVVVSVHDVGEPAPELDYLREHARAGFEGWSGNARVSEFLPREGDIFVWSESSTTRPTTVTGGAP